MARLGDDSEDRLCSFCSLFTLITMKWKGEKRAEWKRELKWTRTKNTANRSLGFLCVPFSLCLLCFKLKQAETNERVFNLNEQRTQREKAKHKTTLFPSIPLLFLFHFRSLHAYIHFVHFIVSERNEKKRRRNEAKRTLHTDPNPTSQWSG